MVFHWGGNVNALSGSMILSNKIRIMPTCLNVDYFLYMYVLDVILFYILFFACSLSDPFVVSTTIQEHMYGWYNLLEATMCRHSSQIDGGL